ncbi:hypothetical protein WA026_021796 [Henosepilachna vigintioctopunctata]|uniref:CRAL-TRIO domain-containing protein n=1 Tax=Henosepilachna vigintioctopunctata TaxID=420089 RepID=A0AAW1TR73_9CUCU
MELDDLKSSRNDIIDLHGKTPKSLQSDVEILREWMKKQPHIPTDQLQDEFLEILLMKNKFSIEKTKTKIESYCTLKGLQRYKYLYDDDISIPSKQPQFYIPLPELTDDFRRIIIGKVWDPEKWELKIDAVNAMVLREILSRYDYSNGEIFLYDLTECSPMVISKLRVNIFSDFVNLVLKAHSARLSEIHLISKFASTFFNWTKPFLPSKIASRVHVHDSMDALADMFSAKCLPSDYGGQLKSLNEFRDDFDRIYADNRQELLRYMNTKAREELRQGGPVSDDMQGTFKKLEID